MESKAKLRDSWIGATLALMQALATAGSAQLGPVSIKRSIGAAAVAAGSVRLEPGQAVDLVLNQFDRDLKLTLIHPDGRKVDVNLRETGPEPSVLVAPLQGEYRLEAVPVEERTLASQFTLSIGPPRQAVVSDPDRQAAQEAASSARSAFKPGDADSLSRAMALIQSAREASLRAGDTEAAAVAAVELGTYCYFAGDLERAVKLFEQALPGLQSTGAEWILAESHSNLGAALWRLGDFQGAIREIGKGREAFAKVGHRRGESVALNNLAAWHGEIGSYQLARNNYRAALAMASQVGEARAEGLIRHNLGSVYHALGDEVRAMATLQSALVTFLRIRDSGSASRTMLRIAEIQFDRGAPAAARRSLDAALPLARNAKDGRTLSDALLLEGRILSRAGSHADARMAFEEALCGYRSLGSGAGRSAALHHLGEMHLRRGEWEEGARALGESLEIRRRLEMHDAAAETAYLLARVEEGHGSVAAARDRIRETLTEVEAIRSDTASPRDRMTYLGARHRYYAFAAGLLMRMHAREPGGGHDEEALEIAERAKGRALLDTLLAPARATSPDLRRSGQALALWSNRLVEAPPGPEADRIRSRLDALLSEYSESESAALAASQGAAAARRVLTAREIRSVVADHETALVHYLLGDEASWAWLVTSGAIVSRRLPPRNAIEAAVRRAQTFASSPGPNAGTGPLRELAQLVLWPVIPANARRIVICPDGALHRAPFGALPLRNGDPLLSSFEILMAPSASVLPIWTHGRSPSRPAVARKQVAIIADPVFDLADTRLGPRSVPGKSGPFGRLGFARGEAAAIRSAFPAGESSVALDFEASREKFDSGELARYRFIHAATHAVADEWNPELSALVLSLRNRAGQATNGYLRLHEIVRLSLDADVVTLSACETGLGKHVNGEGPLSLARGFLEAGARAVVMSTWRVDDESTSVLMREFYRDLATRHPFQPAESLRRAQERVKGNARWTHPYYWAGWIIMGTWK
ncbi:MAG: CHAT domain-containing tetratricopeptide repeat protein [Bryobacteraceae bacterium]